MKCTSAPGGTGSYTGSGMMSPSMATAVADVWSRCARIPGNISSSLRSSSRTEAASTSTCATPPVRRRWLELKWTCAISPRRRCRR